MRLHKTTIFIIMTAVSLYAENVKTVKPKVDWINGAITAEGKSPLNINDSGEATDDETGERDSLSSSRNKAYEKAKEAAILDASKTINDIQVDPSTKIKDLIIRDRDIRQRITQYLHENSRFREKPAGYLYSACELEFRLGYIINALNIDFPETDFFSRDDIEITTKYTSIIIDTRGLHLKPMLLPSFLNESGLEVYSRNNISGQNAIKHLIVSYAYSENEAMKHKKAGTHPYFCTALKSLQGNPVLSDEDIKRVFSHKENLAFLKKCRVIFIIDR